MKNKFDTYAKGFEIIDSQNNDPLDYLRTPRYSRKSLDIPARILNHWDKMELLLRRNPLGATYSFNLAEAFWIKACSASSNAACAASSSRRKPRT